MIPDSDEEWLREIATGVANGTHVVRTPSTRRSPLPQGEPFHVSPIQQVREADLHGAGLEVIGGDPAGNDIPTVELEDSEGEGTQLDTEGHQQKAANTEVPPLGKGKKRKHGGDGDGKGKKHKSKSKSSSHRSGSSSRYRSFALDEEFAKKTYEEYVADPLAAVIHTVLYLGDLAREERAKNELQMREVLADRDVEKKAKETALVEMERVKNQLMTTNLTLVKLRSELKEAEKLRDDLQGEKAAQVEKISGLEARIKELEGNEASLRSEVNRLTSRMVVLEKAPVVADSSSSSTRLAELEKELEVKKAQLARSEEKAQKTAQLALKMREKYFNLALAQVLVVNPDMQAMKTMFDHSYGVEEGKIVKVDPSSKGKVVVYPPAQNQN